MQGETLFSVQNRTRGGTLASRVLLADTPRARRLGLLPRNAIERGEGLWILPTQSIHTVGMHFPIDVVFLDRRLRVRRIYHRLAPFRLTRFVWGAASALELAPGSLAESGLSVGDELQFTMSGESRA